MEFKNRKWWQWLMIALGTVGLLLQVFLLFTPQREMFSWIQVIVSGLFLWGGTVPRKGTE